MAFGPATRRAEHTYASVAVNLDQLLRAPAGAARRAGLELRAAGHIARSGMIGIEPPHRTFAMLRALQRYGGIGALPTRAAIRDPDGTAIVDEAGRLTYAALDARSNALANEWHAAGIGSGSGVAILCRNHRGFLDRDVRRCKLGARMLLLNTDFAGPQVRDVCAREDAEAIVFDEEFAGVVAGAEPPLGRYLAWHDGPVPDGSVALDRLVEAGDGQLRQGPMRAPRS